MTSSDLQDKLSPIYQTYNNVVKLLIADIESRYEKFPPAIFNEIRALHDHIARCYVKGVLDEQIENEITKAESHLKRIILDCFKYLNVYLNDTVVAFEKRTQRIDLASISDGEFYIKYKNLRNEATSYVREAKITESTDKDSALELFEKAYNSYSDLDTLINVNHPHICRAKAKYSFKLTLKIILWIASVIAGGLISLFISCNAVKEFINTF